MVSKFVRNQLIKGGITVGLIILAIEGARRFQVAQRVTEGARGLGEATGLAVSKPFAGIVGGVASGLEDLQAQIGRLGIDENFGCGVLRDCSADPKITAPKRAPGGDIEKPSSILDLNKIFSTAAIRARTTIQERANTSSGFTNRFGTLRDTTSKGFGGFGSAAAQETALQEAIRQSTERFSSFFRA